MAMTGWNTGLLGEQLLKMLYQTRKFAFPRRALFLPLMTTTDTQQQGKGMPPSMDGELADTHGCGSCT